MKTDTLRKAISIALLAAIASTTGLATAQEAATSTAKPDRNSAIGSRIKSDFDLPAGELSAALNAFRIQSGVELVFRPEQVTGKQARAVHGRMDWSDALGRLLQGTGLEYRQVDGGAVVIKSPVVGAAPVDSSARTDPDTATSQTAPATTDIAPITVTGTRIRGGVTPSPVITISAENVREEGFTDLGEVIRNVPQNFAGGQNPEIPSANLLGAGLANQNLTGGSGLNLRGLGPDASLTLLNGRRMAYDGFSQAIDISAIPVEALERIEIVADGASAIYGSDAVGGIVDVILKREFEGAAVGARYGTATDGGLTTREYTATAGTSWATGGLIATYKDESVGPVYADERSYTRHLAGPRTIFPGNDLHSGLFSVHQAVGDAVEFRLDALRAKRRQRNDFLLSAAAQYYRLMPETTTTWFSPTVEILLPHDWMLTIGGAWGRNESVSHQSLILLSTGTSTLLYNDCYCNAARSYDIGAEGPLFRLPGGDARLAVGAGRRTTEFEVDNYLPEVNGLPSYQGAESSRFAYTEISLPLVGPESDLGGVNRLVLTAAARSEDYDSFGRVTTPQFGVIYGPSADFSLKGTLGRSFKAPTLYQNYYYVTALLYPAAALGGAEYPADATAIYVVGGDRELSPERARTWSASLAFHPETLPNLEAELTWFHIDYTDRVVQPFANAAQGLSNAIYAPFVDYSPTIESQMEIITSADGFLNYAGAAYDPDNVVAILRGRYVNVSHQRIEGIDLSGSHRFDVASGKLTLRGSVSWLDSAQQLSPGQGSSQLAGTLHNPARVNGRFGLVWNRDGFTISTFANYTGGVKDTVNDEKGASFSTFDATLRYAIDEDGGAWPGLEFAFSAQNLLDRKPPLHTPPPYVYALPYDPTNYSAVGRFLALSMSMRW